MRSAALILCILFFSACATGDDASPENILPKEKMAKVMVDMQLLEASLNLNNFHGQKVDHTGSIASLNLDVFRKHDITKDQYDSSFEYYCRHPQELSEVYQLVLNELSLLHTEVSNSK
jgi:hypothetical protein